MSFAGTSGRLKVVFLTTDNRWHLDDYANPHPHFGPAPEATLAGLAERPEVEIHIVANTRRPVTAPEKLAENIWFHSLHVPKLGWLRTAYQGCIRATRKKIRAIQPDIVHGQGTECDNALCAVFSGFPNVVTLHGNMVDNARSLKARPGSYAWFAARFENLALRRTAGVLCNSSYTEAHVRPRTRRTWRVPNAMRGQWFSEPRRVGKKSPCVLLHTGVICENKQQLKMLEVARSLHRKGLQFELQFIGNAQFRSAYVQAFLEQVRRAEQEGFAPHLEHQPIGRLIESFDQASALVHTPILETFGLVVAEALARDLKVFGFRVGGVPDIVEGADGSVLVEAEDWQGLENAIAGWLAAGHPEPRSSTKLMRERYHPEANARRHVEIYREVLAQADRQ
jgi:glycosyltransferase involved in cell wall biosynthesis